MHMYMYMWADCQQSDSQSSVAARIICDHELCVTKCFLSKYLISIRKLYVFHMYVRLYLPVHVHIRCTCMSQNCRNRNHQLSFNYFSRILLSYYPQACQNRFGNDFRLWLSMVLHNWLCNSQLYWDPSSFLSYSMIF